MKKPGAPAHWAEKSQAPEVEDLFSYTYRMKAKTKFEMHSEIYRNYHSG
jgi:hypothetical protein